MLWQMIDTTQVRPTDFVGFADVRVVATAHLEVFERPEATGERFLCAQHFDWQSAVDALRETMPHLRSRLPVGTPGAGKVEDVYRLDGSKAERILGIKYIPWEASLKDSFEQFLQAERKSKLCCGRKGTIVEWLYQQRSAFDMAYFKRL